MDIHSSAKKKSSKSLKRSDSGKNGKEEEKEKKEMIAESDVRPRTRSSANSGSYQTGLKTITEESGKQLQKSKKGSSKKLINSQASKKNEKISNKSRPKSKDEKGEKGEVVESIRKKLKKSSKK